MPFVRCCDRRISLNKAFCRFALTIPSRNSRLLIGSLIISRKAFHGPNFNSFGARSYNWPHRASCDAYSSVFCCCLAAALLLPKPTLSFWDSGAPWKLRTEAGEKQPLKVRELVIDGRIREYTTGATHEVTDRLFVVRRAYRINDALPEEKKPQQWVWRLDGWISVDRQTGHVAQLNLPAFDGDTSEASWYRDYAAYCGASDDGAKTYMVVSQLGKRKPVLRKGISRPRLCRSQMGTFSQSRHFHRRRGKNQLCGACAQRRSPA